MSPVASMSAKSQAQRGLVAIFASTFFELVGVFMMQPLNLLRLKDMGADTLTAGLFASVVWVSIFVVTPMVTHITTRLGRRRALWLSAALPVASGLVYALTTSLWAWVAAAALSGMAGGLRWILAESLVAEFSPDAQRGAMVGWFETMVGATFVLGPVVLSAVGPSSEHAVWVAWLFLLLGALVSLAIPPLPTHALDDHHHARGGLGIWRAFRAAPVIMFAGFAGGFFEAGLTSMLPLYGLALGLGAAGAALLVSASGLGSSLAMWPMGRLSDAMAQRHGHTPEAQANARLQLMRACALTTLLATLVLPWVASTPALAWPLAFVWGGAGGSLYTLAMIDIGSRSKGVALENATAVLVLSYTLGGMLAPSLGSAALQWSPRIGFVVLLTGVAALAYLALRRWGQPAAAPQATPPTYPHDHPRP
jgi:MFS family permease